MIEGCDDLAFLLEAGEGFSGTIEDFEGDGLLKLTVGPFREIDGGHAAATEDPYQAEHTDPIAGREGRDGVGRKVVGLDAEHFKPGAGAQTGIVRRGLSEQPLHQCFQRRIVAAALGQELRLL